MEVLGMEVWIKLLTVLLGMPSFGVEPDPAAPSAAEVTRYAPAQSDAMVYADLQGFVPNNYQAVVSLPAQPEIKADKQASAVIGQLIAEMELGRNMLKGTHGFDPVTDVKWVAAWVTVPDAGEPDVLVVVRGNLPADAVDKIAGATGMSAKKVGAGRAVAVHEGKQLVGIAADGTLIAGSAALVTQRLSAKWKPTKATPRLAALLDGKPFLALVSTPSNRAIRRISKELSDPDDALARDMFSAHTFAALAFAHDGLWWTWTDRTARGFNRASLASDGVIELMRAGHLGTRGMVRVALAALGSFAGADPAVAAIDRNQATILRIVEAFTGDGTFQVQVDKSAATRTVSVHAWDKELARVIPGVGAVAVIGAIGAIAFSGGVVHKKEAATAAPAAKAKPAAKPVKPAPTTQPSRPARTHH